MSRWCTGAILAQPSALTEPKTTYGDPMSRDGLSLRYRLWWNIRRTVLTFFGPAQLGSSNDPIQRLERERAQKIEEARGQAQ